ncbi:MAG: hypothetical protein WAN03_10280 [Candidatus Sulfotelmatobacter sp.]
MCEQRGRRGQQARCQFEVVQIFAAEILRELGVKPLARNLNHSHNIGIAIHNRHRHQLLNRRRRSGFVGFTARLNGFEDARVLHACEVIKDLRLLAERRVSGDCFTRQWNRARRPQIVRKDEAQQAAFQPHQRDFRILHAKNLGHDHAQVHCRNSRPQHRSQGQQVLGEYDLFHHPVIAVLTHRGPRPSGVALEELSLYRTLHATRYFLK